MINITSAGRLIGSFVIYILSLWLRLGVFGVPLASLGRPWAPFDSLWGALGLPLAVLWGPFGRLGAPVGSLWGALGAFGIPLGHLWDPIGASSGFCSKKLDVIFRVKGSHLRCLRTKSSLPEFSPGYPRIPRLPPDSPEVVSGTAARTPPPHAPGVRMT